MINSARRSSQSARTMRIAINSLLILVIVFFGAPFLWVAAAAFDADPEKLVPWPNNLTLTNFRYLFRELNTGRALGNSLLVATCSMVLGTLIAALAGFGLSRLRMRGKSAVMYGVLLLYTMPLAVTMVATYDLAGRFSLLNTYAGLILAETAILSPLLVWLMKQFYDAVPRDLDEAASLDGGTVWQIWREIASPVVKGGIALTAAIAFMLAWAEVLLATVLISSANLATLPLKFFFAAESGGDTGPIAALAVLYIAPVLVVFLLVRSFIGQSLTTQRA